jgi:hypothetical protein
MSERPIQITVRLHPLLKRRLDYIAQLEVRSLSQQVERFAQDGVNAWAALHLPVDIDGGAIWPDGLHGRYVDPKDFDPDHIPF